jgi:hypothetical protein
MAGAPFMAPGTGDCRGETIARGRVWAGSLSTSNVTCTVTWVTDREHSGTPVFRLSAAGPPAS